MALLVFFVMLALGVSFMCSIMEAVLLSVTPGYIGALEEAGDARGPRLRRLKNNIDEPLSAILSLNTIAHTVGATGAGAQAVEVFGEAWIGLISAVLTLLILVVSEIIPKTLGAVYWRGLAGPVARTLEVTMRPLTPLIWMSNLLTRWLSRGKVHAPVSREEITALADIGKEHGALGESESRILKSLMRFQSLRVRDVMTPRTVMFALPRDTTVGEAVGSHPRFRFSRLVLYREGVDEVSGYVLTDVILRRAAHDEHELKLAELERAIEVVPESLGLTALLERLIDKGEHIALVVDEFGGTAGLVTLEDAIETLLGLEIVDEADTVEDLQALARQRWRQRAERLGLITDADAAAEAEAPAGSETPAVAEPAPTPDGAQETEPDGGPVTTPDGAPAMRPDGAPES